MGKKVIIFRADMSLSVYIDNKNKDLPILGKDQHEAIYPIRLVQPSKRFVLSVHYNGNNRLLFVNVTKYINSKQKKSKIKDYTLCLGNISKDFTINNMKKTGLKGIVKLFSVDFNPTDTSDVLDIHKYLMKRIWYKIMFELIKKRFTALLTGIVI